MDIQHNSIGEKMSEHKPTTPDLRRVRAVLFDMDGVLYVSSTPLPGVQELLDYLDATQRSWLCVTNNATRTSAQFAARLADMGVRVAPDRILGSAEATAAWLEDQVQNHGAPQGKVIVMGMEGLREALLERGFELTTDPFAATYAVAGAHFKLTFADLADACLAIRNGARFIGTNGDLTFPTERGQVPGAGSMLALLEAATGVKPFVIGKPNAPMYELAMWRLGASPQSTMMVGDRYETDIAGALPLGMITAGVLTGISTLAEFVGQNHPPHLIVEGLPELLVAFKQADGGS
jgi:4-nitrophenyl phosphatase